VEGKSLSFVVEDDDFVCVAFAQSNRDDLRWFSDAEIETHRWGEDRRIALDLFGALGADYNIILAASGERVLKDEIRSQSGVSVEICGHQITASVGRGLAQTEKIQLWLRCAASFERERQVLPRLSVLQALSRAFAPEYEGAEFRLESWDIAENARG
jgi:hypothetical protein